MALRGIRGATTVEENTKEAISQAVQELMQGIVTQNELCPEDIGAAIFTATEDITALFPAAGARQLPGFDLVPLFDARQMDVTGALPRCIRVLVLADVDKPQAAIRHVYLREARKLRPDLVCLPR